MFTTLITVIALTASIEAAPGGGSFAYGNQQKHCHTKYNIKVEQACHAEYDQVCHEEYDTVVDTSYVEECQDIVTKQCHQVSQQIHHSTAVVGHDSQIVAVANSGHYGKRDADPGHSDPHNHLQCFSKPHKECHQKPVHEEREECHVEHEVIVDIDYIEECEELITTHCEHDSETVENHSRIVGGESQVVDVRHEGYGEYHKREAVAGDKDGYNSGPKCHEKKDHKCHKKPIQNERKIPHTICKKIVDTTYIEECEETFTTKCHNHHSKYHTSTTIAGHESYTIEGHEGEGHENHGHVKREAEAGHAGYTTAPQCQAKTDRQCHKKPVQSSHQIPRQVCVPVARQVCVPYEVKIPYEVCGHSYVHREQYTSAHGYGYGR